MNNKIIDIQKYKFNNQDRLLLDTNVWLHIYADKTNPSKQTQIYSQAFASMQQAGSQLFIDVIIYAEFINNYVRLRNIKKAKQFKQFRDSKDFSPIAQEVTAIGHDILKHCQKIHNHFESMQVEDLLNNYSKESLDFTDQLIVEICNKNNFILVTDDGDFENADCTLLTANPKLLNSLMLRS